MEIEIPKSPVFGMGRNKNHRPNGAKFHAAAGSINMHGKKTKRTSCMCCVCVDLRDKILAEIHKHEMKGGD